MEIGEEIENGKKARIQQKKEKKEKKKAWRYTRADWFKIVFL